MATLRAIPRSSFALILSALIIAASISFAAVYTARSDFHDQTFYGCLFAGSLSQVNTTAPPANCGRGEQIQWNAQGIEGLPGKDGVSGLITVSTGGTMISQSTEPFTIDDYVLACPVNLVPIGSGYSFGTNPEIAVMTADYAVAADNANPFGFPGGFGFFLDPSEYGWQFEFTVSGVGTLSFALYVYCATVAPPA